MRVLSRLRRFFLLLFRRPKNVISYLGVIVLKKPLLIIQFFFLNRWSGQSGSVRPNRFTSLGCTLGDDQLVRTADEICSHNFKILGSELVTVGDPIDWKGSALESWRRDSKYPWELSRFYHAPILAEAYRRTGGEKYLRELRTQIMSWIECNPLGSQPNWAVAMEASIRSCNWTLALDILGADSLKIPPDFYEAIKRSLIQHAYFILVALEYQPVVTNHLLADYVGLLYIGVSLGSCPLGRFLARTGIDGVEVCMKRLVYADGVSSESSIAYHRLAAELFGCAALACTRSDYRLSDEYMNSLWRMFEYSAHYTKPNGRAPHIGDSDNGRLHILTQPLNDWDQLDHSHLFALAHALWPHRPTTTAPLRSVHFQHANVAILRSERFTCIIDAGCNGQDGNGGHAHNDALSFELNVDKTDFIVDPGTGVYALDPTARNLFRSTRMHNTVVVDGREQNRIPPAHQGLFWLHNDVRIKNILFHCADQRAFFAAEHTGYSRLADPVIHRRSMSLDGSHGELVICDEFNSKESHTLEWNFHLAPAVRVNRIRERILVLTSGSVALEFTVPESLDVFLLRTPYSPSYGVITESSSIRCTGSIEASIQYQYQFNFSVKQ